jgi:hypothetical protein
MRIVILSNRENSDKNQSKNTLHGIREKVDNSGVFRKAYFVLFDILLP